MGWGSELDLGWCQVEGLVWTWGWSQGRVRIGTGVGFWFGLGARRVGSQWGLFGVRARLWLALWGGGKRCDMAPATPSLPRTS